MARSTALVLLLDARTDRELEVVQHKVKGGECRECGEQGWRGWGGPGRKSLRASPGPSR